MPVAIPHPQIDGRCTKERRRFRLLPVATYLHSVFLFVSWIGHYDPAWLIGDVTAGITVGCVVVPQSMAYSVLANLPPQFGLYSALTGVLVYWMFGTSKDISIGPVAVLSTIVGNVVKRVGKDAPHMEAHAVASAFCLIIGSITLLLGLCRCGWIVDLVPLISLSAFTTGSAITIAVGQLPALLGLTMAHRGSPYVVIREIVNATQVSKPDCLLGCTCLLTLWLLKIVFKNQSASEGSQFRRYTSLVLTTMRSVLVIIVSTFLSWIISQSQTQGPVFRILGHVPSGLPPLHVPHIDKNLLGTFMPFIPACLVVMLVEHVAIAKSFARANNYSIDPSQEMVAIGFTNLIGPFIGAYPSTGSFTRTAIQSKAGANTPVAGIIAGIIVLLAVYVLPTVFFYIPSATLAAVIVHAVGDLMITTETPVKYWIISPIETCILVLGIILTVLSSIEHGIYGTICLSIVLVAFRPMMSRSRVYSKEKHPTTVNVASVHISCALASSKTYGTIIQVESVDCETLSTISAEEESNLCNSIKAASSQTGIFVHRFTKDLSFLNTKSQLKQLSDEVLSSTTQFRSFDEYLTLKTQQPELAWNRVNRHRLGHRREALLGCAAGELATPNAVPVTTLKAVILDLSAVNHIDITAMQLLIDMRRRLDYRSIPETVKWCIIGVHGRSLQQSLALAGLGLVDPVGHVAGRVQTIASDSNDAYDDNSRSEDSEEEEQENTPTSCYNSRGLGFYVTLEDALNAASSVAEDDTRSIQHMEV